MYRSKNLCYVLGFIGMFILSFESLTLCQDNAKVDILRERVSIQVSNQSLLATLRSLARQNHIPIGVEFPEDAGGQSNQEGKISIDLQQEPLGAVLDEIFRRQSSFRWVVIDGVVNILPQAPYKSILDTKVSYFKASGLDREEFEMAVYALPELRDSLKRLGCSPGFVMATKPVRTDAPKISIDLKDTTVRNILNTAAKTTYFWSAVFWKKHLFVMM